MASERVVQREHRTWTRNLGEGGGSWTNKSELPLSVDVKTRSIYFSQAEDLFWTTHTSGLNSRAKITVDFFLESTPRIPRHNFCQRPCKYPI